MKRSHSLRRSIIPIVLLCLSLTAGTQAVSQANTELGMSSPPAAPSTSFKGWSSLGRPSPYRLGLPALGVNKDGRQELFAIGSNGEVWHAWQTSPSGDWSSWLDFSGTGTSYCAAVGSNADGRMELFALWYDLAVWHTWQGSPNNPFVGSWQTFGWPQNQYHLTCPRIGRNVDGRLEVFSIGADGNVWALPQVAPSDGWAAWASLGKPAGHAISSLVWGHDADLREALYALGDDNAIWFKYQQFANDGWSGWYVFPKSAGVNMYAPAVGWNQDGRQELFMIGDDGNLWTLVQAQVNADLKWFSWGNLGKPPTGALIQNKKPTVGQNLASGNTMEVFAQTYDGAYWHIGQVAANGGWGQWASLGQPPGGLPNADAIVGNNSDGNMVLFAVGNDGAIWQNVQQAAPAPPPPAAALKLYLPLSIR